MNEPCIILRSINPIKIYVTRALTQDEWSKYLIARKKLLEFESVNDLFSLVESNGSRVIDTHRYWLKQYNNRKSLMDGPDLTNVRMDMNRTMLNFLSMVKTFSDHVETYLKRNYGETSSPAKTFKAAQSAVYDKSPSYRIMYQLRNYAQHCGLPIQSISFSSQSTQMYGTIYTDKFLALCDRDHLLLSFDWKKVRPDVEQQEKHFDIIPHVFEYMQNLFDIYEALTQIDESLISSAREIKKLLDGIDVTGFIPCVGSLVSRTDGDEELQYSMQDMPVAVAEGILAANESRRRATAESSANTSDPT